MLQALPGGSSRWVQGRDAAGPADRDKPPRKPRRPSHDVDLWPSTTVPPHVVARSPTHKTKRKRARRFNPFAAQASDLAGAEPAEDGVPLGAAAEVHWNLEVSAISNRPSSRGSVAKGSAGRRLPSPPTASGYRPLPDPPASLFGVPFVLPKHNHELAPVRTVAANSPDRAKHRDKLRGKRGPLLKRRPLATPAAYRLSLMQSGLVDMDDWLRWEAQESGPEGPPLQVRHTAFSLPFRRLSLRFTAFHRGSAAAAGRALVGRRVDHPVGRPGRAQPARAPLTFFAARHRRAIDFACPCLSLQEFQRFEQVIPLSRLLCLFPARLPSSHRTVPPAPSLVSATAKSTATARQAPRSTMEPQRLR